ncbi:MAG: BON domain-containing protein [Gammaproteobacteria bacterium]|jgi:hyperosmotically inducible periplasmic protein|nr:BON domain-containing protein [Gammaproteobacteria bacterium]MBU0770506.1 BON domain-containing protein [Gammaproteobacteria bacterium]MBU1846010.1 BON domain-containing protein [Gammaproteobacteria bacterium]
MISRHTIATVLTTTAIAYSISTPAQAASLASIAQIGAREPVTDDRDRGLADRIKAVLDADSDLQGSALAIEARGGHVTLSGVVLDAHQLSRALQATLAVPGVRDVDTALEIAGR